MIFFNVALFVFFLEPFFDDFDDFVDFINLKLFLIV